MKMHLVLPIFGVVAALSLTGCVSNTEGSQVEQMDTASIAVNKEAAALVPADIAESGELQIGTHTPFPPNEFRDADGEYVGWSVDLTNAIAARLGLEPQWQESAFETIIPSIQGGKMDLGSASFTDNATRQEVVDFVNYYEAGVLWVAPVGAEVDPNNACGHTVAVKQGSFQHTDELPAKSEACVVAGNPAIEVLPFDDQAQTTNSVLLGKSEAFSADSPVALDAILMNKDKIAPSGEAFDVSPYGFVVEKGSPLGAAVQLALQSLIDDGTYLKILTDAGVEAGAVTEATMNAGH